jgi:hypothetical protein
MRLEQQTRLQNLEDDWGGLVANCRKIFSSRILQLSSCLSRSSFIVLEDAVLTYEPFLRLLANESLLSLWCTLVCCF